VKPTGEGYLKRIENRHTYTTAKAIRGIRSFVRLQLFQPGDVQQGQMFEAANFMLRRSPNAENDFQRRDQDLILMLNKEGTPVAHLNRKGMKGFLPKQFQDCSVSHLF
jgi:hypothetical protein